MAFSMCLLTTITFAQQTENKPQKALWNETMSYRYVPSITDQIKNGTFIKAEAASDRKMLGKDKRWNGNKAVPGKGLPLGDDPLVEQQRHADRIGIRTTSLVFETTASAATPSDPTGAVGKDFYIASWNTAFRIFNKDGSPATPAASLGTLFGGRAPGDPIVLYDAEADRYLIIQFDGPAVGGTTNGYHFAVSETNDPVNGGWHVYAPTDFNVGSAFPDYEKVSIWSDGYYITANIGGGGNGQVWALEREKMLVGDPSGFQAFDLPGIQTNGFYSPQIFNVSDGNLPSNGNATVVYMQDDQWAGVDTDHLKLWSLNIDWDVAINSSISAATEIPVTPFKGVFDGGSFSNLEQPSGPDIDCMQATIMNQAQFRKFGTHNSAVFNFVVNTSASGELAGVRWYEMRQTADGQPWTVYQEGTYCAPDGRHAFAASMAMDSNGNIGMGYSSLSNTEMISVRYTGQFAGAPLGVMNAYEGFIAQSTSNNPSIRYADYSHLTIDAETDKFWFNTEYFNGSRRDVVGVFELNPLGAKDVGVLDILDPNSGSLSDASEIVAKVQNFGTEDQFLIPVSYTINGGAAITEVIAGPLAAGTSIEYTFSTTADLSNDNISYEINVFTELIGDEHLPNDASKVKIVTNATTYCEPSSNCSFDDGVNLLQIGSIDHISGCIGTGYINSRAVMTDLNRATGENSHVGNLQVGYAGDEVSMWIDFNDNGDFEDPGEQILNTQIVPAANADTEFTITIPTDAPLGDHVMRVRGWDPAFIGGGLLNIPCDNMTYGKTEDFVVNITDSTLGVNSNILEEAELTIISKPNQQYDIKLRTAYNDNLSVSVFNTLGQQVVFNNISKTNGSEYVYQLDMSFASSGVYLVKMGLGRSVKVGKIIVK